jgi:very-short-patch-repair endonuclease
VGLRPDLHWAREAIVRQQVSLQRQQLIAERAWCMRNAQTSSELALWQAIRRKQLGVSFKRQFPIGNHVADFAAPSVKLAIEVDGGYHANRAAADARKDRHLRRAGYRVLRIPADLVMRDISAAIASVRAALA